MVYGQRRAVRLILRVAVNHRIGDMWSFLCDRNVGVPEIVLRGRVKRQASGQAARGNATYLSAVAITRSFRQHLSLQRHSQARTFYGRVGREDIDRR